MDFLYSTGRKPIDPRYCRTHAGVARLFASSMKPDFNADAWIYVAQAWSELANLKEVMAREASNNKPLLPPDFFSDVTVHGIAEPPHQI